MVLSVPSIDRTKRQGRRDHRDEQEKGNGHGLLVEIDHLFDPVRSNSPLEIVDETLAPRLGRLCSGWEERRRERRRGETACS